MTQLNSFKSIAFVAFSATAIALTMSCGGKALADTPDDTDPIEGVWESDIVITDCASSAVLRTFKGVGLFQRGGALTADNSLPRAAQGIALGYWKRDAKYAYTAGFRFFRFNADATLAGTQKVQRTIVLSTDNKSFTGTLTAHVMDTAGTVLQSTCGSETAVRIY